jgi:hypothetical protein
VEFTQEHFPQEPAVHPTHPGLDEPMKGHCNPLETGIPAGLWPLESAAQTDPSTSSERCQERTGATSVKLFDPAGGYINNNGAGHLGHRPGRSLQPPVACHATTRQNSRPDISLAGPKRKAK